MQRSPRFSDPIAGRGPRGASLLEAVVTLSIFTIVIVAVYATYDAGNAVYARGTADMEVQDEGRKALDAIAKLSRSAGNDPSGAGIFGFRTVTGFTPVATESTVLFSLDANGDGVLDTTSDERVGFALFGTELRQTTDGVNPVPGLPPLARNIRSLRFAYFTASNVPIPNPAGATYTLDTVQMRGIRRMTVQVTVAATAGSQGSRIYTLSTDVRPRNL